MSRLSPKVVAYLVAVLFLAAMWEDPAQAETYTLTVAGSSDGVTERSIGATEGCADFNIDDLTDIGLRNYRIWLGMSRLEPEDDDGVYGFPMIDEIKKRAREDLSRDPDIINWGAWDHQLRRTDSYHWSSGCSPSATVSLLDMLTALRDKQIVAVVTLRNVDDNGEPAWATQLNPPKTPEGWSEWWEHVFATVYWLKVKNGLEVHDWQVHNEPDSGVKQGWGGTFADYTEFVRKTRDAIQFVYDTYPYLAGKTFRLYAPVTTGVNSWVEQSILQNDHVIDVVDWHNYSSSHYAGAVQVNEWIDKYDSDRKDEGTYISEWGSYRSAYGFSNPSNRAKTI
ncbi:MAG: hypothetical protein MUC41_13835 [Syntrophobacteraceae bacterium]|jgi:hypothetical protein|nr:hypothetical protein [Syntrophobacteraceae bacterium]